MRMADGSVTRRATGVRVRKVPIRIEDSVA
jgi:hypothetical protein